VRKGSASPARLAAVVVAASIIVAGCQPVVSPSPAPSASSTPAPKKVKIVSSLPLQSLNRVFTVPIVNAIKLALEEQGGRAGNTIVEYESYDDASAATQGYDPEVEAANARKAAADPSIVAYIGTYNSGAARLSIPITCQANLAMVSPTNTYPGLTKPYESDEPGRYYPNCRRNYARVIPADDIQGTVGARWAKELGAVRVYVLHDGDASNLYGRVTSESFRAEANRIGLQEVGYASARKANVYKQLANDIAASGADFVYYGGTSGQNAGFLLRDLKQASPSIRFMGPDGIADNFFFRQAGDKALGAYITSCCVEVKDYIGSQKTWAEKYKARFGESADVYSIYGYEAAKVVLAAIAKAAQRADDRAKVRDLVMATTDFDGVLGRWSFDANGDTSLQTMAGLKIAKIGADYLSSIEFEKALK